MENKRKENNQAFPHYSREKQKEKRELQRYYIE